MSDSDYDLFTEYIASVVPSGAIQDFKSNMHVTNILEHVSFSFGEEYLSHIKMHFSEDVITQYCMENDKIGGGKKYEYAGITTSPSNFRYLLHAHLILSHMVSLGIKETSIVEIGCGYGGLCLAVSMVSARYGITIRDYHLVDLPSISALQQLYLSSHSLSMPIQFHSAYTYGSEIPVENAFLISNYCFSELSRVHQAEYIRTLFPKIAHGFMVWNHIPLYDFGFPVRHETEYPLTGSGNEYVYF